MMSAAKAATSLLLLSACLGSAVNSDCPSTEIEDPVSLIQLPTSAAVQTQRGVALAEQKAEQKAEAKAESGSGWIPKYEVVGELSEDLDNSTCRNQACEYGIFLSELLLAYSNSSGANSEIAIINGGAIRAGLKAGPVTMDMIEAVHPFGNSVTYMTLYGSTIATMIINMLAEHGPPGKGKSGSFLQMAGLRFQATWNGTGWTLQNAVVATNAAGWQPLLPLSNYSVVTNTYIKDGNGGRNVVMNKAIAVIETPMNFSTVVAAHFRTHWMVSPPAMDDRIMLMDANQVVGQASKTLVGGAPCKDVACSYGIVLCEEMLRVGKAAGYGTQIALYNGGGIKASVAAGPVTNADLLQVHPYGNVLSFITLRGQSITKVMEDMLLEHGPPGNGTAGSFLQMAGLRFQANWNVNTSSWTIVTADVHHPDGYWYTMVPTSRYSVVTNSYVRFGNGGRGIIHKRARSLEDTGPSVLSVAKNLFAGSVSVGALPQYPFERACLLVPPSNFCMWPNYDPWPSAAPRATAMAPWLLLALVAMPLSSLWLA